MGIEEEFKEILKKNLPAHVGDTLKEALAQGQRDAEKVKVLTTQVNDRDERIRVLEANLKEYSKHDDRNAKLDARDVEITNKEREFKLHTLEYQLAAEKDKSKFAEGVALGLVRNTSYRESILDIENETSGHYDDKGNWIPPNSITKSYSKTTTKD